MKTLIGTTFAIGTTEVLLMGIALARNKYLAVIIGPEGLGIYGLLNSFFVMIAVFAGTWITAGTTKYMAEYHAAGDEELTNKVYTFAVVTTTVTALLLSAILILERKRVLAWFLPGDVKEIYYIFFCIALLVMTIQPVLLAVLQGMQRVREVVISRWSISGLDLVLVVVLVLLFGLTGFFMSILLSAVWGAGIMIWAVRRKGGVKFASFSFKDRTIALLLSFGLVNLFLTVINLGSQYLQRLIILRNMDLTSVGLFQAGIALMGYLGITNRGTMFYYLPKMSELMDNTTRSKNIEEYLRFTLLTNIPLSVLAILFGRTGILILYSSSFDALSSVFFWFVLGHFLNSIGSAFQLAIVGMAKLKIHTVSSIAITALWVLLPVLLIKKYGLAALGMGFVAGGIAGPILNFFYLRKCIDFSFKNTDIHKNTVVQLFGVAALTLTGAIVLKDVNVPWRIAWAIISFSITSTLINRNEWTRINIYLLRIFEK